MKRSIAHWNVAQRDGLRQRVAEVLATDDKVARVELHGSLASGNADLYSDIDFAVHLRPRVTDREYFLRLPAIMDSVAPRLIDGVSFAALPGYAGTFYFQDVPLFWHVDIGCLPAEPRWHVDSGDLANVKRWEQRFKMWIKAVKRLLRAEGQAAGSAALVDFNAYFADLTQMIGKRMDLRSISDQPRVALSELIDMEIAWHRREGVPGEAVFAACQDLRTLVLA